jgi:hypothetical protein
VGIYKVLLAVGFMGIIDKGINNRREIWAWIKGMFTKKKKVPVEIGLTVKIKSSEEVEVLKEKINETLKGGSTDVVQIKANVVKTED